MTVNIDPLWFCDPSDQGAYRRAAVAQAAYFKAQQRGFAPGHELDDWVEAEHELYAIHAQDGPSMHGAHL